jgi:hypothetical protein
MQVKNYSAELFFLLFTFGFLKCGDSVIQQIK